MLRQSAEGSDNTDVRWIRMAAMVAHPLPKKIDTAIAREPAPVPGPSTDVSHLATSTPGVLDRDGIATHAVRHAVSAELVSIPAGKTHIEGMPDTRPHAVNLPSSLGYLRRTPQQ